MTDICDDDPLTIVSCALSDRIRMSCREILDPEIESGRITYDEAFQLMLTALTYELIEAGRAIELSNRVIVAGVQSCLSQGPDSEVKH